MTEERKDHRRYYNISVLRVLACLGVFVCHLVPLMGIGGADAAGAEALVARIANFGASGVYLFFVISGFLACTSDENRRLKSNNQEKSLYGGKAGDRSLLSYYAGRARRILPQYYLVILYEFLFHTFITHNATPDPQGLRWLRYFFMTSAVIPAPDNFWGNLALTWTIPLFVSFYLLAPLFLLLIRGKHDGMEKAAQDTNVSHNRQLLYSEFCRAVLFYIGLLAAKYIWLSIGPEGTLSCLYYMHFFALGMVVRTAVKERKAAGFLLSIGLVAAVLYFTFGAFDYFTVVSWIYAVIMLVTCLAEEKAAERQLTAKAVSQGKTTAIIGTLDKYSYDIYLAHGVVFEALTLVKPRLQFSKTFIGIFMFISMIALTALGAVILHRVSAALCKAKPDSR